MKDAPFDGFPKPGSPAAEVDLGIACVAAMRQAIGSDVELMVDCHSFFDVPLAQSVARRLEQYNLRSIKQPMSGGELLFGTKGFAPLTRRQAVNVIMPDVKHCGGLLEMTRIAAMANADGVAVSPHNPSGPVSTAANVQVCAAMASFRLLELQCGEVGWRSELVIPEERFEKGSIQVPVRRGFGIQLNDKVAKAHPI